MKYSSMVRDYSIVTIPRVGSNYFQDRIFQHTGVFVQRFHNLQDNKMITIARDPIELMTSELTMRAFYDKAVMDRIQTSEWKENVLENFNTHLSGIDDMTLVDRFDIVIDYRNLIDFPFETTKAVCDIIGLEIINTEYVNNLKDYTEHNHILSSKRVDEYQEIKTHIQAMDLSKMYKIYDALLARCITIPGIL